MGYALSLHTAPQVPLEAEALVPERLLELDVASVERQTLMHGNERVALAEFFKVAPISADLVLEGDLGRVKLIGANMTRGRLTIHGDVGQHLGAGMSGGEILVHGNAGDWVGPELTGGRITVHGNAGHLVGAAFRGSASGIHGGEIIVHGDAGNEIGGGMRRGLIVIGGNCGDFAGVNLIAGTVVVCGQIGARPGAGMKRGTILTFNPVELLPTFSYDCRYAPVFLRHFLLHLRALGLPVTQAHLDGEYLRWRGDAIELARGEILVHAGS